ncbi:MAG TPA: NADP-dependent malic enzyme [Candidatus Methylomirabilis sp.]|nr:NADP-dependent malic enzyme [Candidatus Methylomirabilis sp.]
MTHEHREHDALDYRRRHRGLIGVESKVPVKDRATLSLVYTPGVAEPCLAINKEPWKSLEYTCRGNTVALVTDGSALFGMGPVGPEAALPSMEVKSVLCKTFAGIDALPMCLRVESLYEMIQVVSMLAPTFGAFCLEDIASPRCFSLEDHLQRAVNVPIFHNHAHGAGVMVLAGLLNALPVVGKRLEDARIVISGAGPAGVGVARLLVAAGARRIIVCDSAGTLHKYRPVNMNWVKAEIARQTNAENFSGSLADALKGADVLVGLSAANAVTPEMIASMAANAVVFALAVPTPEILPAEAKQAGAKIVATGRSDFPNQLDIALVFPGVLRGLLDIEARNVTTPMLLEAAKALAGLVPAAEVAPERILPPVFDFQVAPTIAAAVARVAMASGESKMDPVTIVDRTIHFIYEGSVPIEPRTPGKTLSQKEEAMELHRRFRGKLQIVSKIPIKDPHIMNLLYLPPGAALPAKAILEDPTKVYELTAKGNLVAVVSDGSAVLGLGNIGARAAMPVMEGKAVLFKTFGGVEAFPICIGAQEPDEIVAVVKAIAPVFGGINLEDISAPRCFEIENRLKKELDIPVFHDDQHGTGVIVLAALLNALKLTGRSMADTRIVLNGAGAASIAVARLLLKVGVKDLILCDTKGIIHEGRTAGMNPVKVEMAHLTNQERRTGSLADALVGADVFIGLSVAKAVTPEMVRTMAKDSIIFAMANPVPEIFPDEAKAGGAAIVATGRSDYENQVNNSLGFPGIFRGALDVRAREINDVMKIAGAHAIANLVSAKELKPEYILPYMLDFRVPVAVAKAVATAAMETGVARLTVDPEVIAENARAYLYEGKLGLVG